MREKSKKIRGTSIKEEDTFHSSDYDDAWDFIAPANPGISYPSIEKPKKCVYCSSDWTPRMETIYIESGYCESCWDSESCHVVICDNCNKIVYAK